MDVKDLLEEASQRMDLAIRESAMYGHVELNIHRNHVQQILAAAGEASTSHGMDVFCKFFMKALENSLRETAKGGMDPSDIPSQPTDSSLGDGNFASSLHLL